MDEETRLRFERLESKINLLREQCAINEEGRLMLLKNCMMLSDRINQNFKYIEMANEWISKLLDR